MMSISMSSNLKNKIEKRTIEEGSSATPLPKFSRTFISSRPFYFLFFFLKRKKKMRSSIYFAS
uniref:Uncharacterized protein n=1 Tax=Rhizophora mucronata TaxID=61149 RepID=A0A2P2QWP0_RHIMU